MSEKIFLLGGYDLEMLEIKKLLEKYKISYYDKKLDWANAKLKMYTDEIKQYANNKAYTLYGIELDEGDFSNIPENYCRIDHHNIFSDLPSSIEQVCALLEIPISRYHRLVAANDKSYISGMKAIGGTDQEIGSVRAQDRELQGVTHEDECLAKQALDNKKFEGDLIIVYSLTSHFSPICDALYPCRKLLVYTDSELAYYGEAKYKLVQLFATEIALGKMYHGGGDTGYIGAAKGKYNKLELENKLELIVKEVVIK